MSYVGTLRRDLAKLEHEEKETHRRSFQNEASHYLLFSWFFVLFIFFSHFHGNFGLN